MSFRIEHRVGVAAAAHAVWEFVSDLSGWSVWNPVHPEINGRLAIGSAIDVVEQFEGMKPRRLAMVVEDWVPDSQILWRGSRGVLSRSIRYIEIEALSDTGCIFANGEIYDGLIGEASAKQNRRRIRAGFTAMGEAVKARVEAG